ncbi:MAG TPA: sigma factor-like helix-turn-helix DNA-binding protein [Patescibacteria group bacterium]|nr:sigma factor-like helix-turn-helix DNA-binding protein [Patescibacteria group bacterium]
MKSCIESCKELSEPCPVEECRLHIDYPSDLNCALIAIDNHGAMTLRQVGERLKISFVRVKQIEEKTKDKLLKRIPNMKLSILSE